MLKNEQLPVSAVCKCKKRRSAFMMIVMATVFLTSHEDSVSLSGLAFDANSRGCTTNAFKCFNSDRPPIVPRLQ
jgi:hypothetical protein